MTKHTDFMKQCLDLGRIALTNGDSPVGSLIVLTDRVIGSGIEAGRSKNDITQHAEILAIKDALQNVSRRDLKKSILYTTHEPCLMCSYVIRHYQIGSIVYGLASDYVGGSTSEFKILSAENIPIWGNAPRILGQVLENECRELSEAYVKIQNKNKS